MRLDVQVLGVQHAAGRLTRLGARMHDIRPAEQAVAGALRKGEVRRFMTRGYGRWPKNRPSTIRKKGHKPVMVDTGMTLRFLTKDKRASRARMDEIVFGVPGGRSDGYKVRFNPERPAVGTDFLSRRGARNAVRDYLLGR